MTSKLLLPLAVNIIAIIAIFVALEMYCRIIAPPPGTSYYRPDPELGWAPLPNLSFFFDTKDKSGAPYTVEFKTDRRGFREWGSVNSIKPKILFVGDSFTGHPFVSNDETYFGRLKHLLDVEVFAIGGGGYGTLQELLLLKSFVKQINPDLFVLQFCSNDFENNSMELEDSSTLRNQTYFRPYLVDGVIKFRHGAWIYKFLDQNSFAFRAIERKFQEFQYTYYGNRYAPAEDKLVRSTKLNNAERTTLILLKQMTALFPPKTKLATFNCDTAEYELTIRWTRAATAAGFVVWPNVSEAVETAERQGEVVRTADGKHWNPRGHGIAASQLEKEIGSLLRANAQAHTETIGSHSPVDGLVR